MPEVCRMEVISLVLDIALVIVSVIVTAFAAKRIISTKTESVQDYIICIFFVFNCLPVLFDYLFGVPQFKQIYWWYPLKDPMEDHLTRIVYDVYMLLALAGFMIYQKIYKVYLRETMPKGSATRGKNVLDIPVVSWLLILAPYLAVIFSGNVQYFLLYGDHDIRGELSVGFGFLDLPALLLMSVYVSGMLFFSKNRKWTSWVVFSLYCFSIIWICGKRYIIAVMLVTYVFFYVNSPEYDFRKRKKLLKAIPMLLVGVMLFSTVYLVYFKVGFRDGRTTTSAQSLYETLRVDFGRDGVIKYTVDMLLREKKSYLDYPGQTILSMFLIWVPRALWKTKPLQHFVYLTADIKGLSIDNAGAGITPSWYETCIANFELIGAILAIVSIPVFCYWADKTKDSKWRGVGLLLMIALLTQSVDVYMFFILLTLLAQVYHCIMGNRKIKITYGGKKLF